MVVTNMRCGVLLNFELYGSCPMSLALFVFVYLGGYLCICLWQRSDWLNQFWTIGRVMSLHPGAQEHRGFLPVQSIWSEQLATPGMIFNDQNCARWLWTIKICRDWLRGSFPGHMHQKNRNMCHIYLVREAVIKNVCPKSVPSPHPPSVHLGLKISLLAKEVGFTKPKTHF